ncbi:Zn-ribbon domain-containing OB-fold protein [Mumia sp. Pv 4-285]|uniref:Zn-ribbon domain-containing OB-fold protein n=1 Tax=Mumia qirimensis TaxID=3234852 RepID=UPI00351CEAB9
MSIDRPGWVSGDVPPADEVTAPYWDATREHRLTVQECTACGHRQHPPRAVCTGCSSTTTLIQPDVAGTGIVDTFTVVHRPPRADLDAPYAVARVRLGEGPIVLTRLEGRADPESWSIGDRVEVVWTDLPDGRALPCFRPNDPTEES